MPSSPDEVARERTRWRRFPRGRPERIEAPGPGQESVWDYPRPPRVEPDGRLVRVKFGGVLLAESSRSLRVLETASPPVFYLPPEDVRTELLERSERETFCEWKGVAAYWSVRVAERVAESAAWSYPDPDPAYATLRDRLAFHAGAMDACWVGAQRVEAQPGAYYGGWITPDVVGPFKGAPGTDAW
jgi:uncharacterized protein (DUF427 family)